MDRTGRKRKLIIVITLIIVFVVIGVYLLYAKSGLLFSNASESSMIVTYLSVGKADCILIESDGMNIMIDTGFDETGNEVCDYLEKKGIEKLDYLILSHSDNDHIGGSDKILSRIQVDKVLESSNVVDSEQYKEYRRILEKKEISAMTVIENFYITGNGMKMIVYSPLLTAYEDNNNYSLVVKLEYKENSFLFAGDSEEVRMNELMELDNLHSDVLKLPHHGIGELNTVTFIQQVSPKYVIVTCENRGIVSGSTIEALKQMGTAIFYTCEGNIVIKVGDKGISVSQSNTSRK